MDERMGDEALALDDSSAFVGEARPGEDTGPTGSGGGVEGDVVVDLRRRIPLRFLLVPFGVVCVSSAIADWTWPSLLTEHPLLLLALSAKNRFLLLTAPQLGFVAFFVAGFLRLIVSDPITYVLGRQYGEQALAWVEGRTEPERRGARMLRGAERLFARAAPLVILIAPSALWCVLAGAARMRVRTFVVCNVVGTAGRLVLFWVLADALREPLEGVLEGIEQAQLPLLALTLGLGLLQLERSRRRRARLAVAS